MCFFHVKFPGLDKILFRNDHVQEMNESLNSALKDSFEDSHMASDSNELQIDSHTALSQRKTYPAREQCKSVVDRWDVATA